MSAVVLDASALLALLRNEPGAEEVAEHLTDAAIGVYNLAEIVSHFSRLGLDDAQVGAILKPLPIRVVPPDEALAWDAGLLRAATAEAGLSLGDRFCLALARREKVPVLTADRIWASIAEVVGVEIRIIR